MIKTILFPVPEGPQAAGALDYAVWLARKDGSLIHGIAVVDVKAFEIPVMGTPDGFMPSVVTPPIAESRTLLDEMATQAKERLQQMARECATRGVASSTESHTGIPAEIIARAAISHDIVVMARVGYTRAAGTANKLDPLVSQVIRTSVRPVLVASRSINPQNEPANIVVAYDGSGHAARALTIAAELGSRPGMVCRLISVAATEQAGLEILEPAESFLAHHGLSPVKEVVHGAKPSDVICDVASGTDILVMGAHGHGPVREMLFGSTTERVLSHCCATVALQS